MIVTIVVVVVGMVSVWGATPTGRLR